LLSTTTTMSKLSFRARALDASKPLPVYKKDEISGKQEYTGHNRAVPQMPTGMEKEEESEHHLQRAISAQQVYGDKHAMVIPVPQAEISSETYNSYYKKTIRLPKNYVTNQAQAAHLMEQEQPDYDMDSEDEVWVEKFNYTQLPKMSSLQFESMMDQLEKACGTHTVPLPEVKLLFQEEHVLLEKIYAYWFEKRQRQNGALRFKVRQERRDGSSNNDSYVAFRRRTEKMQTRKNRKSDEAGYSKMVKLRREFCQVVMLMELVQRREFIKTDIINLTLQGYETRLEGRDLDGKFLRQAQKDVNNQKERTKGGHMRPVGSGSLQYRKKRHASGAVIGNQVDKSKLTSVSAASISRGQIESRDHPPCKKAKKKRCQTSVISIPVITSNQLNTSRNDNKRRVDYHRPNIASQITSRKKMLSNISPSSSSVVTDAILHVANTTDNAITMTPALNNPDSLATKSLSTYKQYEFSDSGPEDFQTAITNDDSINTTERSDNQSTFERCTRADTYLKVRTDYDDFSGINDVPYRFNLTTLTIPNRNIGFVRRRVGRGGRILLDRVHHPFSRKISKLDLDPEHDHLPPTDDLYDIYTEIKNDYWPHYRASEIRRTESSSPTSQFEVNSEKQVPSAPSTESSKSKSNNNKKNTHISEQPQDTSHNLNYRNISAAITPLHKRLKLVSSNTTLPKAKYECSIIAGMTSCQTSSNKTVPLPPCSSTTSALPPRQISTKQQKQRSLQVNTRKEITGLGSRNVMMSSLRTYPPSAAVSSSYPKSSTGLPNALQSNPTSSNIVKVSAQHHRAVNGSSATSDSQATNKCVTCGCPVTITPTTAYVQMAGKDCGLKLTSTHRSISCTATSSSATSVFNHPLTHHQQQSQQRTSMMPVTLSSARAVVTTSRLPANVLRISSHSLLSGNISVHQQQQNACVANQPGIPRGSSTPVSIKVNIASASSTSPYTRGNEDGTMNPDDLHRGSSHAKSQANTQQQRNSKSISFNSLTQNINTQHQPNNSPLLKPQRAGTKMLNISNTSQLFSVALTPSNSSSSPSLGASKPVMTLEPVRDSNNMVSRNTSSSLLATHLISGRPSLATNSRLLATTTAATNHGNHASVQSIDSIVVTAKGTNNVKSRKSGGETKSQTQQVPSSVKNSKSSRPMEVT